MVLNSLIEKAWMNKAPKRAVKLREDAKSGVAPGGPDALPKAIGKPATQALLSLGITKLSEVAEWSEAELLEQHGIGPKAVGILREALSGLGLRFSASRTA